MLYKLSSYLTSPNYREGARFSIQPDIKERLNNTYHTKGETTYCNSHLRTKLTSQTKD